MNTFKNICVVLVLVGVAWVWANWAEIKVAWKYRAQLQQAADLGSSLVDLGVLK